MPGFNTEQVARRWGDGGHGYGDPKATMHGYARRLVIEGMTWLPGHGMYREDKIAMLASFILCASEFMAIHTDPARTAAALRRLADLVERGRFEGAH